MELAFFWRAGGGGRYSGFDVLMLELGSFRDVLVKVGEAFEPYDSPLRSPIGVPRTHAPIPY